MVQNINPPGWPQPKGYSNGTTAAGRMVFVGGQIGWNGQYQFETDDFVEQVRQTLKNTLTVLKAAGAGPEHMTRMTWYVTDKKEYLGTLRKVGEAYREVMGKHYPAMALVQVAALLEDRAKVEIETTAMVPE